MKRWEEKREVNRKGRRERGEETAGQGKGRERGKTQEEMGRQKWERGG